MDVHYDLNMFDFESVTINLRVRCKVLVDCDYRNCSSDIKLVLIQYKCFLNLYARGSSFIVIKL